MAEGLPGPLRGLPDSPAAGATCWPACDTCARLRQAVLVRGWCTPSVDMKACGAQRGPAVSPVATC
eukprot:199279-Chlamydomonas_euryale.AAC.3